MIDSAATEAAARLAGASLFGPRQELADTYAALLATDGLTRGLLGPRESDRLWSRHLINSAALSTVMGEGLSVADVGSGAGLPGIPVALARPDLSVTLIEPLLRRSIFLNEAVSTLGLSDQVTVVRSRAEDLKGPDHRYDVVTSRAVAPLDRLVKWCLPLMASGGEIVAIKGSSVESEIAEHQKMIDRSRLAASVQFLAAGPDVEPTIVVRLRALG